MPFVATWKDLDIIKLSEVNQSNYEVNQTRINVMWYHLYVDSKFKRYK